MKIKVNSCLECPFMYDWVDCILLRGNAAGDPFVDIGRNYHLGALNSIPKCCPLQSGAVIVERKDDDANRIPSSYPS